MRHCADLQHCPISQAQGGDLQPVAVVGGRDVVPDDCGRDTPRVERLERRWGPVRRQGEQQGRTVGTGQAHKVVGGLPIAVHSMLHPCHPTVDIDLHHLLEFHGNMLVIPLLQGRRQEHIRQPTQYQGIQQVQPGIPDGQAEPRPVSETLKGF